MFLFALASCAGAFTVNAQSSGIDVDAELGDGWSYSDVYGAFYELGNGWNYSDWFGTFYTQDGSWFWRPGFGWTYLYDGATLTNWWIYVYELSDWCWTNNDVYPFVNSINAGGYVWFDEDILGFYNSNTGQYASAGVYNVDIIFTNLGYDQATWNAITDSVRTNLMSLGGGNFYRVETSGNSFTLRYNFGTAINANAVRNALAALNINVAGFYSITVQ